MQCVVRRCAVRLVSLGVLSLGVVKLGVFSLGRALGVLLVNLEIVTVSLKGQCHKIFWHLFIS